MTKPVAPTPPRGHVVEIDAMDVAEWESGQSTPQASDANLAELVRKSAAPAQPTGRPQTVARERARTQLGVPTIPKQVDAPPRTAPPGPAPKPTRARTGAGVPAEPTPPRGSAAAPPVPSVPAIPAGSAAPALAKPAANRPPTPPPVKSLDRAADKDRAKPAAPAKSADRPPTLPSGPRTPPGGIDRRSAIAGGGDPDGSAPRGIDFSLPVTATSEIDFSLPATANNPAQARSAPEPSRQRASSAGEIDFSLPLTANNPALHQDKSGKTQRPPSAVGTSEIQRSTKTPPPMPAVGTREIDRSMKTPPPLPAVPASAASAVPAPAEVDFSSPVTKIHGRGGETDFSSPVTSTEVLPKDFRPMPARPADRDNDFQSAPVTSATLVLKPASPTDDFRSSSSERTEVLDPADPLGLAASRSARREPPFRSSSSQLTEVLSLGRPADAPAVPPAARDFGSSPSGEPTAVLDPVDPLGLGAARSARREPDFRSSSSQLTEVHALARPSGARAPTSSDRQIGRDFVASPVPDATRVLSPDDPVVPPSDPGRRFPLPATEETRVIRPPRSSDPSRAQSAVTGEIEFPPTATATSASGARSPEPEPPAPSAPSSAFAEPSRIGPGRNASPAGGAEPNTAWPPRPIPSAPAAHAARLASPDPAPPPPPSDDALAEQLRPALTRRRVWWIGAGIAGLSIGAIIGALMISGPEAPSSHEVVADVRGKAPEPGAGETPAPDPRDPAAPARAATGRSPAGAAAVRPAPTTDPAAGPGGDCGPLAPADDPCRARAATEAAQKLAAAVQRSKRARRVIVDYSAKPSEPPPPSLVAQDEEAPAIAQARAAYMTGNQRLFTGDVEGAIRAYQESLDAYPGYVGGYRGLGLAYAERGDKASALTALNAYVASAPTARDVALIKKRIARLQGK